MGKNQVNVEKEKQQKVGIKTQKGMKKKKRKRKKKKWWEKMRQINKYENTGRKKNGGMRN